MVVRRKKWGGIQNSTQTPACYYVDTVQFKIPPCQVSPDILKDYYEVQKLSTIEISRKLGTSPSVIQKQLEEYGIKARPVGSNIKRKRGVSYGEKIVRGNQKFF